MDARSRISSILGLLLLYSALLPSCEDTGFMVTLSTPVHFENVENYGSFTIPVAGTDVIRADSTWQRYWRDYWNNWTATGKTPAPVIDFTREMVVAVFYGEKYSGCSNEVEVIQDILQSPASLTVRIGPLPALGYCDARIAPLQMVRIPASTLPVTFTGMVPK